MVNPAFALGIFLLHLAMAAEGARSWKYFPHQ
jgi:hypothetical protein